MKKLALLFTLAIIFISCEGPEGPRGFDGTNIVAQSFQVTVDFNSLNNYSNLVEYPNNIQVLDTDLTLIYILFDQVPANDGGTIDVWRLLPQTIFTDFGQFQYNFDATNSDAEIFLDAPSSFNFNNLSPADLENQTFRVVILPVDIAQNPLLDVTDYNSVVNIAGLGTQDIITIE